MPIAYVNDRSLGQRWPQSSSASRFAATRVNKRHSLSRRANRWEPSCLNSRSQFGLDGEGSAKPERRGYSAICPALGLPRPLAQATGRTPGRPLKAHPPADRARNRARRPCASSASHGRSVAGQGEQCRWHGQASALAVLRLITKSNFVGCWTGKSAGFVPLKILST
jgi:hypothetical protein